MLGDGHIELSGDCGLDGVAWLRNYGSRFKHFADGTQEGVHFGERALVLESCDEGAEEAVR